MNNKTINHLFVFLVLSIISFGCDQGGCQPTDKHNVSAGPQTTFNVSDNMISSNGNIVVAIKMIGQASPDAIWNNAKDTTASIITKNPYLFIGTLCKIYGRVSRVEAFPLYPELPGHWSEILMLTANRNSPLGTSNVGFIYNGDIATVNSRDRMTCAGYYVGTYETENAFGGKLEVLVIVGNIFKLKENIY